MPDGTPWYFSFNDVSDDEPIIDDGDNDVVDDPIEFENQDEQEEEDLIVDPYYSVSASKHIILYYFVNNISSTI